MNTGKALTILMDRKDISITRLAEKIHMSKAAISHIRSNRNQLTFKRAVAICRALHISMDDFTRLAEES